MKSGFSYFTLLFALAWMAWIQPNDVLCEDANVANAGFPCERKACTDPNAEFVCGGGPCQRTCANLNRPCCIYTFAPVNACFCKKGFAQNYCGKCVPERAPRCQREKLPPCKCGQNGCGGPLADTNA